MLCESLEDNKYKIIEIYSKSKIINIKKYHLENKI